MIRVLVLAALASCTADDGGPRLDSVTPTAAPRGARVVLAGARLCGDAGDCARAAGAIRIGASSALVQATIVAYGDRAAEIEIPDVTPLGPTQLVVTVNELASNALAFDVLATEAP